MITKTIFIALSLSSAHPGLVPVRELVSAAERRTLSVLINELVELMTLIIVHELRKGELIQLANQLAEFFVRISPFGELLPVNIAQRAHDASEEAGMGPSLGTQRPLGLEPGDQPTA